MGQARAWERAVSDVEAAPSRLDSPCVPLGAAWPTAGRRLRQMQIQSSVGEMPKARRPGERRGAVGAGAGSAGTDGTPHGHQANHDVAKLEAPSQHVGPRMWCGGTHGGRRVWSLQAFEVGGRQEGRLPSGALLACLAVGLRAGFSKPFPRRELRCRLALEMVPDRPVALRRGDARNDRTSGAAPAPDTAARCTGPYLVRCSKRFHAGRRAGAPAGRASLLPFQKSWL